jgi:hypothetical protein
VKACNPSLLFEPTFLEIFAGFRFFDGTSLFSRGSFCLDLFTLAGDGCVAAFERVAPAVCASAVFSSSGVATSPIKASGDEISIGLSSGITTSSIALPESLTRASKSGDKTSCSFEDQLSDCVTSENGLLASNAHLLTTASGSIPIFAACAAFFLLVSAGSAIIC